MLTLSVPSPWQDPALTMTDTAGTEQWLAALPLLQPQECAQQIIAQLGQLNACILPLAQRQRLLALYQTHSERLLPLLLQEARPLELSNVLRARAAANGAQQLLLTLHHGHKLVAVEQSQSKRLFNGKARLDILTQTLLSARDLLWLSARSYSNLPQGFWLDCHRIKLFAGKQAGDELAVAYRQILLLGMTACNRFSPSELEHLLPLIRKYAPLLQLRQHEQLPAEQNIFVFHPDLDSPPRFLAELPLRDHSANWWQADASAIIAQLQERIASLTRMHYADPQASTDDEKQLSLRLRQQWEQPPHRRLPRHLSGGRLQLVSLLPACWFVANKADWGFPVPDESTPDDSDEADLLSALSFQPPARPPPPPPSEFDIVNTSGSGLLLRGQVRQHPIRAGEIVLLHQARQPWQLGIVRWVNLLPQGLRIEYGVELAGVTPQAVMSRPVITHHADRFQMALQLPALPALDTPAMLLLPGRQYEKLREFRIIDQDGEQVVRLTRLAIQTAHYQFAEFRPA